MEILSTQGGIVPLYLAAAVCLVFAASMAGSWGLSILYGSPLGRSKIYAIGLVYFSMVLFIPHPGIQSLLLVIALAVFGAAIFQRALLTRASRAAHAERTPDDEIEPAAPAVQVFLDIMGVIAFILLGTSIWVGISNPGALVEFYNKGIFYTNGVIGAIYTWLVVLAVRLVRRAADRRFSPVPTETLDA